MSLHCARNVSVLNLLQYFLWDFVDGGNYC